MNKRAYEYSSESAMLNLTGNGSVTTCDGITRRDFLQVGVLGAIGLSLAKLAELQAMGAAPPGADERSCIMIFNLGAPSQIDTFDMKPDAPAEIRGPFKPIRTNNPGHPDLRDVSAAREAGGQIFPGAQLLSHRRRRA